MSSPIVDYVREIPLIVEKDYPMENGNTGFPFDDDREDSNATFRSQLDDIAARHPEFAHHLGSFPFTSGSRTRAQIPEEFTQQRFTDRPFPERFERFGFPFEDEPLREEHTPYYQKYPKYYPQDHQENRGESSSSREPESDYTEPSQEAADPEEPGRSRKLKNIQQSNTVDLGQRQEPVDDRNQRSMSAPPPNNRQRFVSSINIPVNQPTESAKVPPNMPQPSAPPQPQERVIPIHVEGRDEPIIPRKFASSTTSQPQANPEPSQPCTDKFFTQRAPNFSQYLNRDKNFQNDWFPKNFQNKHPQAQTSQRGRSPQPQPKPETTHHPATAPEQAETPQKHPAEAPPKCSSGKPDPIDQIKSIQKDVSALMAEVDKFAGQPKDKRYIYLDEMLTRNLIKLDDIDTQGQENIRLARKEAIKCIQKCISILESKANCNAAQQEKQSKESEESKSKKMEVESTEQKDLKQEGTGENKHMNVEKAAENEQNSAVSENKDSTEEKMEVDKEKVEKNADGVKGSVSEEKMETSEENKEPTEKQEKTGAEEKEDNNEAKKEPESTNEENETRTELKNDTNTKNIEQKD